MSSTENTGSGDGPSSCDVYVVTLAAGVGARSGEVGAEGVGTSRSATNAANPKPTVMSAAMSGLGRRPAMLGRVPSGAGRAAMDAGPNRRAARRCRASSGIRDGMRMPSSSRASAGADSPARFQGVSAFIVLYLGGEEVETPGGTLEMASCGVCTRVDSANGDLEDRRDLLGGHELDLEHHEDDALVVGHPRENALEGIERLIQAGRAFGSVDIARDVEIGRHCARLLDVQSGKAPIVRRGATTERKEPAAERDLTRERRELPVHGEEDLVEDVLDIGVAHAETSQTGPHEISVLDVNLLEIGRCQILSTGNGEDRDAHAWESVMMVGILHGIFQRRTIFVGTFGAALVLMSSPVSAAAPKPRTYELRWKVDPSAKECSDGESRVVAAITERLGLNPFATDATRAVEIHLSRRARLRQLSLTFIDEGGMTRWSRVLESSSHDCTVLLEAAGLAIAVAIREDLDASTTPAVPEEHPPDEAPPRGTVHPSAALSARVTSSTPANSGTILPPRPGLRRRATLGVALAVATGALPGLAPGFDLGGRLELIRRVSVSGGMTYFPDVEATDRRFRVGLTIARAGICVEPWRFARAMVSSCLHGNIGGTYTLVSMLQPLSPEASFFAGGAFGQWAGVEIMRGVFAVLGIELSVPYPRYKLTIEGTGHTVFTTMPVLAYQFFGIALRTPEQ